MQHIIKRGSSLKQTKLMKAAAAERRWRSVCQSGCRPFCTAAALDRAGGDPRECGGGSQVELSRPVMVCDFLQTDTGPWRGCAGVPDTGQLMYGPDWCPGDGQRKGAMTGCSG